MLRATFLRTLNHLNFGEKIKTNLEWFLACLLWEKSQFSVSNDYLAQLPEDLEEIYCLL